MLKASQGSLRELANTISVEVESYSVKFIGDPAPIALVFPHSNLGVGVAPPGIVAALFGGAGTCISSRSSLGHLRLAGLLSLDNHQAGQFIGTPVMLVPGGSHLPNQLFLG